MAFARLTDEALIVAAREARQRAHDAPKCMSGTAPDLYISGDAWARRASEWCAMCEEMKRRGLSDAR